MIRDPSLFSTDSTSQKQFTVRLPVPEPFLERSEFPTECTSQSLRRLNTCEKCIDYRDAIVSKEFHDQAIKAIVDGRDPVMDHP